MALMFCFGPRMLCLPSLFFVGAWSQPPAPCREVMQAPAESPKDAGSVTLSQQAETRDRRLRRFRKEGPV